MKSNKMIQGYFLLDKVKITPEYEQQLNELKKDSDVQSKYIKSKDKIISKLKKKIKWKFF